MISKEEAKAKLRKAGYSVVDDNSVITVLVSEKTNIKNTVKNVKEIFLKNDYHASFGVRQTGNSPDELDADVNSEEADDIEVVDEVESADEDAPVEAFEAEVTEKKTNKTSKKTEIKHQTEEDGFFDDEDDNPDSADAGINLDEFDMDMLLNEDSVQFSLEDFGMM